MTLNKYFPLAFGLSLGGTLFAGYLSGVKLLTQTCAFGESCPLVWGYSACHFGLAMFAVLLVSSAVGLWSRHEADRPKSVWINLFMATVGVIFAGTLTIQELWRWRETGVRFYGLGLSSCFYGAVFFLILLILTVMAVRSNRRPASVPPPV